MRRRPVIIAPISGRGGDEFIDNPITERERNESP